MSESNSDQPSEGTVLQPGASDEAEVRYGTPPARTDPLAEDATQSQSATDLARALARSRGSPPAAEESALGDGSLSSLTEDQLPEDVKGSVELSRGSLSVPGYRLLKQLGKGTYGLVYLAEEQTTGVRVAIKLFRHGIGLQWQLLQAEVKQLALLDGDPGIVHLRDVEPDAVPPYYVMTYMEGGSLAERLARGPLPAGEALTLFRGVAEALAYVHAKGIRHCDLKPGNVLLDARGKPHVADFGQAHLSNDASPALGTFFYMAPEQADLCRQIPDTRWDVYGLGALLYAMLTGRPPREDSTLSAELSGTAELSHRLRRYREAVLSAPPPAAHRRLPGVDRALAEIIDRCLEVEPARRLRDANEVLQALDLRERQRRQRPLLLFGLLAPLLLLAVLGGLGWYEAADTLENFREGQVRRVLQSSRSEAYLIANALDDQFNDQLRRAVRIGHCDEVHQAALDRSGYPLLHKKLARMGENRFASWALVDRDGTLLVGEVFVPTRHEPRDFYGQNFSWRSWFNGERDHPPADRKQHYACQWARPDADAPAAYVTAPYRSKGDDRTRCLGVSVPVFKEQPPEQGRTLIGVFLANIDLSRLHHWLASAKIEDRSVVLLDNGGHCVLHTDLPDAGVVLPGEEQPSYAASCASFRQVLRGNIGTNTAHRDPIANDGRPMLAGFSPFPALKSTDSGQVTNPFHGWGVVVQYPEPEVLAPVAEVSGKVHRWGFLLSATAGLLLLGLWAWLLRILRHREQPGHA